MIVASHNYQHDGLNAALEFLKRTRWELRMLRKVRVWADRFQILDINGDCFEITNIGYGDEAVTGLLRAVNAAYDPKTIHDATDQEYKEIAAGRRHPWAEDRVM